MRNTKIATLNVTIKDFFRQWLLITRHFHKMTAGEIDLASLLLYYHYEFQKDITNDSVVWKVVFDYDTKLKIREELDITDNILQNRLSQLRRKKVIIDNKVSSYFIPSVEEGAENFKVIFNYNIKHG